MAGDDEVELRLLKYALEVHRKQSFTKAATSLHIAQPSLSQQLAKLERELGVTLFYRGHGLVVATPEGLRFLEQAEEIVRLSDDLEREMRESSGGVGRELTIGAPAITGGHVLPPLLKAFGERYPQVRVRLVEESTENLQDLTVRGLTDLSILALPVDNLRLKTRHMLTEPLFLVLPPMLREWMSDIVKRKITEFEQGSRTLPLHELAQAPFIVLKQGFGFRQTVLELCAEAGFQPNIAHETSSVETAQSLVAHGLGVTLVPAMVMRRHTQPSPLYLLLESRPTRTLVFAYRDDRYLSLAARAWFAVYDELQ